MNSIRGIRHLHKVLVMFLVNHMFVGTWFFETKRRLLNSLGYHIGEETKVVGPLFCTAQLIVGERCWIGKNLHIHGNGIVTIGDNCDVAPEVVFITGGHEIGAHDRRAGKGISYSIHIGNGTWVGARSTILRDVTIGAGCVIASCSCVVKNVEDDLLVAGSPARTIRRLDQSILEENVDE